MGVSYFQQNDDIFICPKCGGGLSFWEKGIECRSCKAHYPVVKNVPLLFWRREEDCAEMDVTDRVRNFYEENPFPDYDDFDDVAGLIRKAKEGVFARLLDEQLPFNVRVLECGCGTGQLTNFLAVAEREVFGVDMCLNSLKLGESFRERNGLRRAHFLQMNLFAPVFRPETFHAVICNGVLHHTPDPFLAFQNIATLVKPGGYILVGLYHKYGRLFNDFRRLVFRLSRNNLTFLDGRLAGGNVGAAKRSAWFADQYQNPHESRHSIGEVLGWFGSVGFEFVKSIPKSSFDAYFKPDEKLFAPERPGGGLEMRLIEASMTLTGTKEGGFFIMIGRKAL
jgi:SAM-dependent methyltransferase